MISFRSSKVVVDACLTPAGGASERDAALEMLEAVPGALDRCPVALNFIVLVYHHPEC